MELIFAGGQLHVSFYVSGIEGVGALVDQRTSETRNQRL